jgi:hypothetical protein
MVVPSEARGKLPLNAHPHLLAARIELRVRRGARSTSRVFPNLSVKWFGALSLSAQKTANGADSPETLSKVS